MRNQLIKNLSNIKKPYALMERFEIDLSLSENPLGCSPGVLAIIRRGLSSISHYPDPDCTEFRRSLSEKFQVSLDKIIIGNGSEQLIDLIPKVILNPNEEAIIPKVTFPLFEKGVLLAGGIPVFSKMTKSLDIDLLDISGKVNKKTKLIFICNPNNPTGKILSKRNILNFIKSVSPINIIVDEANIGFGGESVVREVNKLNNLVVLRTFSKVYGLAGLRVGIGFGPKRIVRSLNKIRQPFPINALAQKCASAALNDQKFLKKSKKFMDQQREFLQEGLIKKGFEVVNSDSNNILVGVDKVFGSATYFVKLLNENNVSVVNGTNFRGLGDKFVRISPRLPRTNQVFLRVVEKIVKTVK